MPERASALRLQCKGILRKRDFQSFLGLPKVVRLGFEKPSFEDVREAFDKVHSISRIPLKQNITNASENIAPNINSNPMNPSDSQAQAPDSSMLVEKTRSFQIHKRTAEEKSRGLDKARLPNYVRDFDEEWNDIEDILQHQTTGTKKSENIKFIMVKGKDWGWRWIPAESVDPDLIEAYLQEKEEIVDKTSVETSKASVPANSIVVWNVRTSSRRQMPLSKSVLEVARFNELEDANRCAEQRFQNNCAGAIKSWKRYRFGNRFIGYVAVNNSVHEDVFTWVEKELRVVPPCGKVEAILDEAWSSTDHTKFTPDTNDTCYETVKDETGYQGSTSTSERVRDGRDFFEMVKSNVNLDPNVYSGAKMNGSLSHLIANLSWRTGFVWRQWKVERDEIHQKAAREEKTRLAIVNTPESSLCSNSVQDGDLEDVRGWKVAKEEKGLEECDEGTERSEDVASVILTPASSLW